MLFVPTLCLPCQIVATSGDNTGLLVKCSIQSQCLVRTNKGKKSIFIIRFWMIYKWTCKSHLHHIDCGQFRRQLSWHLQAFRTPVHYLWRTERLFRFPVGRISAHHKPISLVSGLWCHANAVSAAWLANNQAVRMFQLRGAALSESVGKFRVNEMK